MDKLAQPYVWLFFRLSGRIGRAAYALAFLLTIVAMAFPLYQFMRLTGEDATAVSAESTAARLWALIFCAAAIASVWSLVALSVKRLHDLDQPGIVSLVLFIPVVSIIAFVALCIMPGNPGPNPYGQSSDAPASGS
jgi:uncharacterized membrane protein YhaH (DUF805 family)